MSHVFKSIALADYQGDCINCGSSPVVVLLTEDGAVCGGELCGSCVWGEAEMLDPDAWAAGDWIGENADYSHLFEEPINKSKQDE